MQIITKTTFSISFRKCYKEEEEEENDKKNIALSVEMVRETLIILTDNFYRLKYILYK